MKPVRVNGVRPFASKRNAAVQPPMTAIAFRLVEINHKVPSTNRLRRHPALLNICKSFNEVNFCQDNQLL